MTAWVQSHFRDARTTLFTINAIASSAFALTGLVAVTLIFVR